MNILNELILGKIKLSQALYYVASHYKNSLTPESSTWIDNECNGYMDATDLPDYRYIDCDVYARYSDGFGNASEQELDVSKIDTYLKIHGFDKALVSKMRMTQNIESLENSIEGNKGGYLTMQLPKGMSDMIAKWFQCPSGYSNIRICQQCHLDIGRSILTVVKSRLIDTLKSLNIEEDKPVEKREEKKRLVFISHASKDREILKLFVDNVLKKGMGLTDKNIVFTSYEATGVVPGDNIPAYIKENIGSASIVLAMISQNYKKSEVCMNEVGAAWALGKTPIQVMLPNTNIDSLGWLIHLDKAARINDEDSLDSLMEVMCNDLGMNIVSPKHWNPSKRDFLQELKALPDCYNNELPEFMVVNNEGKSEIECHPRFVQVSYYEKMDESLPKAESNAHGQSSTIFGGLNAGLIKSLQDSVAMVQPLTVRHVHKTTNYSYVKVQLFLLNNSNNPIENGKILITSDNEDVKFAEENTHERGLVIPHAAYAINQKVYSDGVTESFPKPINPTAQEKLYDFYITAPADIKEFKLQWKLESLQTPAFGEINVKWIPQIDYDFKSLDASDQRIGTTEIIECTIEE